MSREFWIAQTVFRLMKIPFAKMQRAPAPSTSTSSRRQPSMIVPPVFFPSLPISLFMHALRSNREQHNYGDTCAFVFFISPIPYTPSQNGSFLSGSRCYAICILDKIQTERAHAKHGIASIDVILGSSTHKFIFDFRNFVLLFRFLSHVYAHFPFQNGLVAVIMQ